jgi:hypothetical protein
MYVFETRNLFGCHIHNVKTAGTSIMVIMKGIVLRTVTYCANFTFHIGTFLSRWMRGRYIFFFLRQSLLIHRQCLLIRRRQCLLIHRHYLFLIHRQVWMDESDEISQYIRLYHHFTTNTEYRRSGSYKSLVINSRIRINQMR